MNMSKADPGHAFRVAEISRRIAEEAELKEPLVSSIGIAALFHDVGKVNIPEELLFKPGELTDSETEVMRTHTLHGHAILSKYQNETMRLAASIALNNHERLDGSGYWGLHDGAISIPARIVAVADVFDALCSDCPYRSAYQPGEAIEILHTLFDRKLDERFVSILTRIQPKGVRLFKH